MTTLRSRVLLLVAGSGLVTAIALGLLMINAVRNLYDDLIYRQTDAFAERVVEMHPDMIHEYERDRQGFADRLQSYVLFAPHTGLYLVSPRGEILATSGQGRIHWSSYRVDLKAILAAQAYDAQMPVLAEDPDAIGEMRITALRPLEGKEGGGSWLMVVSRSADLLSETSEMVRSYALRTGAKAALLTLTIVVALTAAMMAVLTRPLSLLTRRVERIQQAGFAQTLPADEIPSGDRNDEIGRLSHAFEEAFERLKQETDRVANADSRRRDMVASVSHDLRTPLTALIGQLETVRMKRDSMPRPEQDRFIDGAFNNAQHLKRLVVALAELGRLDDPAFHIEPEPIALHELCDDVAHRFQTRAESLGVRLTVGYPDRLPLAQVDAGLIERALSNLLDNALRLTPAGGSAAVDIAEAEYLGRPALRLSVSDSGPGIALEDQDKVFDRFFQGSEHRGLRGSSGLGLAIVSRVAELHGGEAGVSSLPGKGAVFHLLLPLEPLPSPARAAG